MVLEALFFVAGAAATVLVGTPIAASLAGPGELRSLHRRDKEARKAVRVEGGQRAFAPLDLGPDKVQWPSQRPWALTTTMKVPQWPSASWNDEHFGKAARAVQAAADQTAATAAARAAPSTSEAAAPVSQAARQASRRQATADAGQAAQKQQQVALEQMRRANPKGTQAMTKTPPPPPQPTPAPTTRGLPPSEVEVEHLIASQGLAGTVQIIMQRTGWEFREAAQYLAQLRRNQ